ncbi:hypothetical protein ACFWF7_01345 [Nocardia sp. NPDC060256]|uniref:hypothetical protein n=1 Tax=unclassified Nocardia TaxID=2637762 RepID=UPI00365E3189
MHATNLNRRLAALAGAVAVTSGVGALLPATACAAADEVTITHGSVTKKFSASESSSCKIFHSGNGEVFDRNSGSKTITIVNNTKEPLKYYKKTRCEGAVTATVAAGETKKVNFSKYGFAFVVPSS